MSTSAPTTASQNAEASVMSGGTILTLAMLVASALNYALNLGLSRLLDPAQFGDAFVVVTTMLLLTAIALTVQLSTARMIATDPGRHDQLHAAMRRRVSRLGLIGGAALIVVALAASQPLQMQSPFALAALGLGVRPFLLLSVDRGALQGNMQFRPLARTFIVEAVVRTIATLILVVAGVGALGVGIAIAVSFIAAERTSGVESRSATTSLDPAMSPDAGMGTTSLLLVGQIIINNGDVLIAKAALTPEDAGVYATIALVGRAVYFLSWSIVSAVFPAAAKLDDRAARGRLERRAFAALATLGATMTAGAYALGPFAAPILFGEAFAEAGQHLGGYALATSLFALANLLASIDIAQGRTATSWALLAGGVGQTVLLATADAGAAALVDAQLIAMASLLAGVVLVRVLQDLSPSADRTAPTPSMLCN